MWISIFYFQDATTARIARTAPPETHMIRGKRESTHTQQHRRIQQMVSHMPETNRNCTHSTKRHPNKHFRPTGGQLVVGIVRARLQLQNLLAILSISIIMTITIAITTIIIIIIIHILMIIIMMMIMTLISLRIL